jgi:hypothetical protein
MDKTVTSFIVLAIIIMLAVGGYELFNSISGGNVVFNKTVTQIPGTFNEAVLNAFFDNQDKILNKTETLSNK